MNFLKKQDSTNWECLSESLLDYILNNCVSSMTMTKALLVCKKYTCTL